MSMHATCGSCDKKVLLSQLTDPGDGFCCPFCGFAFAPGYAMAAPGMSARLLVAQSSLTTTLEQFASLTRGRLRIDPESVLGPVAAALPPSGEPDPATQERRHRWGRRAASPPPRPRVQL
jgi:hypothetical protein